MTKQILRSLLCLCFGLLMIFEIAEPCFADDQPDSEIVRVGWYPIEKLQEHDANGNPSGFGLDCLEALTRYTGFTYEYVEGTFEECFEMLKKGEIDILLFMKYTPERGYLFDFSDFALFKVSTYLTCLAENANDYTNIESIDGKTVAMEEGAIQEEELNAYIQGKNIRYQPLYCKSAMEAKNAVDNGLADFTLIPSIVPKSKKQTILESINLRYASIAVNKFEPELLQKVNQGMASILDINPNFFRNRYKIYFGDSNANSFFLTKEEKDALRELGVLRVYLNDENGYLSRYEDGEFKGIRVDLIQIIALKLGVDYEFVRETNKEKLTHWQDYDDFDFVSGAYFDYYLADERGIQITSPYLTKKYYAIRNKSYTGTQEDALIAALKPGNYFTDSVILPNYQNDHIVYPGTMLDCLKMVNDGKADMTFLSSYMAEYYLQGYEYNNVTTSITDYSTQACFGTRGDMNPHVVTAMNKAIESITDTEMEAIIVKNMVPNESSFGMRAFILQHLVTFFSVMGSLILAITVAAIVLFYNHKLKANNIKLQEANAAKSEFLSHMSHDIRTPLNVVLGFTKIAQDDPQVPAQIAEYLDKVQISGNYLLELVNDVLDMSKIENGKVVLHEESVNRTEFLNSVANAAQAQTSEKGITFLTDFSQSQTPWVLLDELRTRQIYTNLLSNAIKFSQSGTEIRWIVQDISTGPNTIHVISTISDQGCGMTEDFMKRMFQPFEQRNPSDAEKGTGIGLSIVKSLTELMGGSIHVESELGKGSTFTLEFDRKIGTPKEESLLNTKIISLSGRRILLCEDHPLNTQIVVKLLEKQGCIVDCANNGRIGVDKFTASETNFYDAILMDIRMPVMNGLDAAKVIRESDRPDAKSVPIIALSANAFSEDIKDSTDVGMNAYLSKPIDPQKLFDTLAAEISRKE